VNNDLPLAYFITWTVYGTHLQGAATGWRKYGKGEMPPQPLLEAWRADRLKYPIRLLNDDTREIVESMIAKHCLVRSWHLWIANPRTNHVHVVVTANSHRGSIVRDQLKANCTTALREFSSIFQDRPVWSVGGDWQCVNTEEELHRVIEYVRDAQDRKFLEYPSLEIGR
jgi:REP element-mobilizing transposase RayT